MVVLRAEHADGGIDRYLVPAVADPEGELREPNDGDGAWRALVAALATGDEIHGDACRFAVHVTEALDALLPGCMIADGVAIIGSLDIVLGEVDR